MIENTPLALSPLFLGLVVLAVRFYAREGAISILSPTFLLAVLAAALLIGYMTLLVLSLLPPYAWIAFGGVGAVMTIGGIWSFFR
jgi:hypothetical protein